MPEDLVEDKKELRVTGLIGVPTPLSLPFASDLERREPRTSFDMCKKSINTAPEIPNLYNELDQAHPIYCITYKSTALFPFSNFPDNSAKCPL